MTGPEGRGPLPRTLWGRLEGREEEGVLRPELRGEGRLRAPSPCRLMIDGRLAGSWAAVWRSGEGAVGPPVTLASAPPRQGPCCLGTGSRAGEWGCWRGIWGLREARERAQAKGATQSTLGGARRGWVGRGWHWEMAEAVVRAVPAGLRSRRHWPFEGGEGAGPGLGPHPGTSATSSYWTTFPPSTPTLSFLLQPPPLPSLRKRLQSLESWMDANSLSWRGGGCVTWGWGVVCRPTPSHSFRCPRLSPGRGILGCGVYPRSDQRGLG